MNRPRKQIPASDKLSILKRYLVEKVPISDLCDQHGLQPGQIYAWQAALFEHGAAALARRPGRRAADPTEALIENDWLKRERFDFYGFEERRLLAYKQKWGGAVEPHLPTVNVAQLSQADVKADLQGWKFWRTVKPGYKFDICDWVDASWQETSTPKYGTLGPWR